MQLATTVDRTTSLSPQKCPSTGVKCTKLDHIQAYTDPILYESAKMLAILIHIQVVALTTVLITQK